MTYADGADGAGELTAKLLKLGEGDSAEQRALRTARRQMNADAGEMLDHARANLDQAFSYRREPLQPITL